MSRKNPKLVVHTSEDRSSKTFFFDEEQMRDLYDRVYAIAKADKLQTLRQLFSVMSAFIADEDIDITLRAARKAEQLGEVPIKLEWDETNPEN